MYFFTVRVAEHRQQLSRQIAESPSLDILSPTVRGSEQPGLGDPAWNSRGWT